MAMRKSLLAVSFFPTVFATIIYAQTVSISSIGELRPAAPTSADTLRLNLADRTCGSPTAYGNNNPYRIKMVDNNITVTLGDQLPGRLFPLCPPGPIEEIDLGRLPPGDYQLTVVEGTGGPRSGRAPQTANFTVADARANKAAPFVRLDHSGTWWDANDSGWGLFMRQDANDPNDNIFIAWFPYTPEGKSTWYVTGGEWATSNSTKVFNVLQTARLPGATIPPPTATNYTLVGNASVDFTLIAQPNASTPDVGKFTYTINGEPTVVRTIQRFKF